MNEPIDRYIEPLDVASVDEELSWLPKRPLFFGGSVVPLYVDDPAVLDERPRPTEDVDLLILIEKGKTPGKRLFEATTSHHRRFARNSSQHQSGHAAHGVGAGDLDDD